jgi:hypothetical protein
VNNLNDEDETEEEDRFVAVALISHVGIWGLLITLVFESKNISFVSQDGHQTVGGGKPSCNSISISQINGGVAVEKHVELMDVIVP